MQKFLFVGIGGSGGRTLRFLRQQLTSALKDRGYAGGVPAAWQFLHIDIPVEAEGNAANDPDHLDARQRVGLAAHGIDYRTLDTALYRPDVPPVRRHLAGWRPDPERVGVQPVFGAGQYRAVGRIITLAGIGQINTAVRDVAAVLQDAGTDHELAEVRELLAPGAAVRGARSQTVVISSVAGGAGAGALLDVCATIRAHGLGEHLTGLLYLPDVFDDIEGAFRAGIAPNTLATVAELMAGHWNDGTQGGFDREVLVAAGVPVAHGLRRGPRYPLLVGRTNGHVQLGTQADVYRATARGLTAWVVSPLVQDTINEALFGNWAQVAAGNRDETQLTDQPGVEVPFNSIGFASVELGRERLARYASERLARRAVERLLRGHWDESVPEQKTDKEAADERAAAIFETFLDDAELRELGPHHNQILDTIRGGHTDTARLPRMQELETAMRNALGGGPELQPGPALGTLGAVYRRESHRLLTATHEEELRRAEDWTVAVQERITTAARQLLSLHGAVATQVALERAQQQLGDVIAELTADAEAARAFHAPVMQRIGGEFAAITGRITPEHPCISAGIARAQEAFHAHAEEALLERCAALVRGVQEGVLAPLQQALSDAVADLREQEGGAQSRGLVTTWPERAVPVRLQPTPTEVLLEPTDTYPDRFEELLAGAGAHNAEGAIDAAVREILADVESPPLFEQPRVWVPDRDTLPAAVAGAPAAAVFRLRMSPEDVLARAEAWVRLPDRPLGTFLNESLADFLRGGNQAEQNERIRGFERALQEAIDRARPLVTVDAARVQQYHGAVNGAGRGYLQINTPLPVASIPLAQEAVERVFNDIPRETLASRLDDGRQTSVQFTTFLSQTLHAMAFSSLATPIATAWGQGCQANNLGNFWQWRRARPLPQAIPVPPDWLRELLRGWFVARLLDRIRVDEEARPLRVGLDMSDGHTCWFPSPLLGPHATRDDLLPAVLESLSVALVLGLEEFRPYQELRLLGKAQGNVVATPDVPQDALRVWIREGRVAAGATEPRGPLAGVATGSARDRADAVGETLRRSRTRFGELCGEPEAAGNQRICELMHEIDQALTSLEADVEAMPNVDLDDGDVL